MRNFTKLILGCALLSISMIACKQAKEGEKAGEAATEQSEAQAEEAAAPEKATAGVLNANLATEEELNAMGLSSDVVTQILEKRPFLSMNDFDVLMGDANKEELYKQIFVPFNLNTTAEADFKMIPGVGDRMAHEFEEYRPYTSIQQFRREIGKYVDEDEVARYENYVFVPVELNTASEEDIKALPGVGDRMAHEFEEYRPYSSMEQFRKEIGKYVDDKELARLERFVYLKD
ncbi:helix-hairpin-helix domain-containing protein [Lentiprolixibacter aurantiacus]|uniref:Helix-hairpin-helix domain-containing protein n=1 Tax=Lentiprolixibacter aurantiacus TaxID=2993939 RepID=A0AAE3MI12_9FLAO|nr:helix-hairpin-helix domain-containing protein [Lentiprolixibacter aurantiacus]MCX2718025.1 helix-hairpin-helix domain-containing protein [Lentiprolixibacter aurantiacus]